MGKTERRQYTAEFKRDAVGLVTTQGYTAAAAARNWGINPNLLYRWKAEYGDGGLQAFPGQGRQTLEQTELRQLRDENRRLRLERDILKKATAFFASHSTGDTP